MHIFLHGPDTYRSKRRLKHLVEAFKQKYDPSGLNVARFNGADFDLEAFRRSAGAAGFLASRRFVAVEGLFGTNPTKGVQEDLVAFLGQHEKGENIIVVVEDDLGDTRPRKKGRSSRGSGPLLHWLLEHSKVETFEALIGESLNRWIRDEVKRQGGRIDPPAVLELAGLVGSDLWQMSGEIAKLVAHAEGKPIRAESVRELVRGHFDENIFHLTDALAERDERRSLELLQEQLQSGSHPLYLLTMLARQFRILFLVKEVMLAEQHPATVATRLKLHPFVAQKAIREAKRFERDELVAIFSYLLDLDVKLKTSQGDPLTMLALFVHAVCGGQVRASVVTV